MVRLQPPGRGCEVSWRSEASAWPSGAGCGAAGERDVDCDTMDLRWLPDGGVEVAGDTPKPFPLFLGPR